MTHCFVLCNKSTDEHDRSLLHLATKRFAQWHFLTVWHWASRALYDGVHDLTIGLLDHENDGQAGVFIKDDPTAVWHVWPEMYKPPTKPRERDPFGDPKPKRATKPKSAGVQVFPFAIAARCLSFFALPY